MPRKKIAEEGMVLFSVKIPRETWRLMRGELAHYSWSVIIRDLIKNEVERLKELNDGKIQVIKAMKDG